MQVLTYQLNRQGYHLTGSLLQKTQPTKGEL